jgi:predicted metalloprotease
MRCGERESENVEDRRTLSGSRLAAGGGLGTLLILIIAIIFGADPRQLLQQKTDTPVTDVRSEHQPNPEADQLKHFVSVVLAKSEDNWREVFRRSGRQYRDPTLVLFTDRVQSACGISGAAVGPFYCPADEKVYIDLSFYEELRRRFKAPGDFAQAYVVAHEVGHHVQKLRGNLDQVAGYNAERARPKLINFQCASNWADFFAGMFARYVKDQGLLEAGDIEEALRAASAVGDDNIQRQESGYVVPDSFTHGTSEQRLRWFRKGYETGDIKQGDTFNADTL